jgi:AraC-like DNA-binding protein
MTESSKDWVELRTDVDTGIETIRAHFRGHAYDPHWHNSYLIGVTEQGVHQFSCRKERHTCIPGSTFLLEPGEIHDGDTAHQEGFTYRMLYLPPDWLEQQLSELFEQRPDNAELSISSTLADNRQLTLAVSHAFLALHLGENRLLREGCLDHMLALMTEHLSWRRSIEPIVEADLALTAQEYLHGHLYQDIGLNDLAEAVGCNRFRLTRSFKQSFSMAPHAYLIQLRLVEARKLLRLGATPAEVAVDLCFSDQSHLGRWFRRAYRITPAQYRKQAQTFQTRY